MIKKITLLCIIVFSLVLVACDRKDEKKPEVIRPVKTMVIGEPTARVIRNFPGRVRPNKEADLSFEVPGALIELPILEGSRVKKNQLLGRIDPHRYENVVKEAQAKLTRAKADYLRAKELVKNDFISKAEYDAKLAAFKVAKANYSTAQRDLRDTTLYAPFDGIISAKYVENFEFVKAKQKICHLQDLTIVDVEINVPQSVMLNIQRDESQNPVAIFEAAPGKEFPLEFKELSTRADPETQTFRVVYKMKAPEGINVLPGMAVTLRVEIPDIKSGSRDFYTVPSSAIFDADKDKPAVWIVDPKTMTVKKRYVEVTRLSGDQMRVTKGLKPGERIVTAGVHFLKEGEKIKIAMPTRKKGSDN